MTKKATAQKATTQKPEATTKAPVFVIKQDAAGHVYVEKHDEKPEGANLTNCFSSELAAYAEIRQRSQATAVTKAKTTKSAGKATESADDAPIETVEEPEYIVNHDYKPAE